MGQGLAHAAVYSPPAWRHDLAPGLQVNFKTHIYEEFRTLFIVWKGFLGQIIHDIVYKHV